MECKDKVISVAVKWKNAAGGVYQHIFNAKERRGFAKERRGEFTLRASARHSG